MKTWKKVVSLLCVTLCTLTVLCGCGDNGNQTVECDFVLSDLGDSVCLHSDLQAEYLASDYQAVPSSAKGTEELSRPKPAVLTWTAQPKEQLEITAYSVKIQDDLNRYDPIIVYSTEPSVELYNLYIGTNYVWKVTAHFSDGRKSESGWASFTTEDTAPRNLYVDGVTNVRDIGGWAIPDGRVRQGMMYRCGRLNESERSDVIIEITVDGIDTMRGTLGVKSEIDLRMPNAHNVETGGITSSPLGEDINYYNVPLEWDQGNYLMYNLESVKEFFSLAADESNYPLIFHCDIGTDRTGLFTILINGLLGVSEEDLYRDYLFSNFGKIKRSRTLSNIQSNYLSTIKNCNGTTFSEKVENCLLEVVGVPRSDIDAIRAIMTE